MGKRIIQQRRGRGSSTYRVPEKSFKPHIIYQNKKGVVKDIVSNPLSDAPLAKIEYDDHSHGYIVAPEGIKVGDHSHERVFPLSEIKEGSHICAIETFPHSGPKLCRSPGTFAVLVSKGKKSVVRLPSREKKTLHPSCRAIIGIPAGDGRAEKPFVKAGSKSHAMKARGKLYPRTSGKGMNIVDHPYGGSGHGKVRRPVSRHAPPGRKVGTVSPRRTGKKK
ncbi:MAG: 50S ribosomal protein L2 [Candidatus Aenigmarchaeota archaeon]|nr:50S ribosomal protein L2 [Candidatus Aenigmarchaeota archaeon]